MIIYDFVPFHIIIPEIKPHVARYYQEMKTGDQYGEPDVDWDSYNEISAAGQCFVTTARDDDILVGYSVYTVGGNLRYKAKIDANNEAVYLEKTHRGLGKELIAKSEEYLNRIGIAEINYITNDTALLRLLEGVGYDVEYHICSKTLKGLQNG